MFNEKYKKRVEKCLKLLAKPEFYTQRIYTRQFLVIHNI